VDETSDVISTIIVETYSVGLRTEILEKIILTQELKQLTKTSFKNNTNCRCLIIATAYHDGAGSTLREGKTEIPNQLAGG
jgi:hypothetical protein